MTTRSNEGASVPAKSRNTIRVWYAGARRTIRFTWRDRRSENDPKDPVDLTGYTVTCEALFFTTSVTEMEETTDEAFKATLGSLTPVGGMNKQTIAAALDSDPTTGRFEIIIPTNIWPAYIPPMGEDSTDIPTVKLWTTLTAPGSAGNVYKLPYTIYIRGTNEGAT